MVLFCDILIAEFYDIRSKGQKVVRACTIRLLNLGPAKHEEVAICEANQRIPNVCTDRSGTETAGAKAEQSVDINNLRKEEI